MCELVRARGEFLDATVGETGEVVCGAPERREDLAAGLVRERDLHLGAPGQRFEQRPLRAGQILEPVREHRLAVPRLEIGLQALGCAAALAVPIPEADPVELRAIGRIEPLEVAVELLRVDEAGLELAEGLLQGVGEARGRRGSRKAVE